MARKGNQQKTGSERHASNSKKKVSDFQSKGQGRAREIKVFPGEELPNENQNSRPFEEGMMNNDSGEGLKNLKKSAKSLRKEKQGIEGLHTLEEPKFPSEESENCDRNNGGPSVGEQGSAGDKDQVQVDGSFNFFLNGEHIRSVMANLNFSDNVLVKSFVESMSSIFEASHVFLEHHRPLLNSMKNNLLNTSDYVVKKIMTAYPIVLKWMMHFGNIILLFSIVWLDCALRGIDSFIRMGTTSFFAVIWFSILSTIAMVGFLKFLVVLVSS